MNYKNMMPVLCMLILITSAHTTHGSDFGNGNLNRRFGSHGYINNMPLYFQDQYKRSNHCNRCTRYNPPGRPTPCLVRKKKCRKKRKTCKTEYKPVKTCKTKPRKKRRPKYRCPYPYPTMEYNEEVKTNMDSQ